MADIMNPAFIDPSFEPRAITFENPTGARGAGGKAAGGRKGAPSRVIGAGERVVLADIDGPGVLRHLWMTVLPAPPERLRALWIEAFYNGADEPSISVPLLDFFCLPHGRAASFASALVAVNEGRGFNSTIPMPFGQHFRLELENGSDAPTVLYYQLDYTLEAAIPPGSGYLHVSFHRENPTQLKSDLVITEGLLGPGRFLGCSLGVRVLDEGIWYGEGEVKMFLDGDAAYPTICGTGLEDYVGSAWGMGRHATPYGGCTLDVRPPDAAGPLSQPDFVGMYRWHLPDPVMYSSDLKVTVQQIGGVLFPPGHEAEMATIEDGGRLAGDGWQRIGDGAFTFGIVERVDDVCATAFVYCRQPQTVRRVDVAGAVSDVGRRPYESADPMEATGIPLQ
ncbi:MAG: glycoside hydrolase family 172 protein [Acidimicrobiales bacterium]|jgi:hypothetical protein